MTEVTAAPTGPADEEEFDERQQPGWLPPTAELDAILQDLNKEHPRSAVGTRRTKTGATLRHGTKTCARTTPRR